MSACQTKTPILSRKPVLRFPSAPPLPSTDSVTFGLALWPLECCEAFFFRVSCTFCKARHIVLGLIHWLLCFSPQYSVFWQGCVWVFLHHVCQGWNWHPSSSPSCPPPCFPDWDDLLPVLFQHSCTNVLPTSNRYNLLVDVSLVFNYFFL